MTVTVNHPLNAPGLAGSPARCSQESWRLGPRYMLRVAGLPFGVLDTQRAPRSVAWADAVLDGELELAATGAALSDLLHEAIAGTEDDRGRRVLLATRRAVFANRRPADPEAALGVLPSPSRARAVLAGWLARRADWESLREQGPGLLESEASPARSALRELATQPRLREGLLLASPSLDTALEEMLGTGRPVPAKRARRTERALVDFLARVAAKTSPFSTFTAVALGQFTGHGQGPGPAAGLYSQHVPAAWRSFPRINVSVLARLADLITGAGELRGDLPVTLTAGWQEQAERVRYVRNTTVRSDAEAAVSMDLVRGEVFFLRRGDALREALGLLAGQPGIRYDDFVAALAQATGAPRSDCDSYARKLMELGLLRVPVLRTDAHHPDPLRDLASRLPALDRAWAGELAGSLERAAGHVSGYASADLPGRRAALAALRTEVAGAHALIGDPSAPVPRTLLYEDVRAGDAILATGGDAFSEHVGAPLRTLGGVFPALDPVLAHKVTMRGYFLARFGPGGQCNDLVSFVHEFHEDLYSQYLKSSRDYRSFDADGNYVPQPNWLRLPQITLLDDARRALGEHMRDLWREGADGAEVQLSRDVLERVAATVAPLTGTLRVDGHFVQLGRPADGGVPAVVLNQSFSGLSFPFTRFTHCFEDLPGEAGDDSPLSDRLRRHHASISPDGAVFAEVVGDAVTTNLNLHGQLTDYQIICPDEHSSLPPQARLPLADLYAEHDQPTDRVLLRSRKLGGREVIPVYLGYLVPMALPEIPRTLLLFAPSSLASVDLWRGVPESAPATEIRRRPRVAYRNVIVHRRRWAVPADALPQHQQGATEAERLLGWRRWQRANGLPDRIFARFTADGDRPKPHYADFTAPSSLGLLDARVKAGGEVAIEEMAPAPEELYVTSPDGLHVAELAIETTARRLHPAPAEGAS